MKKGRMFADGGSRGNPGPAASGAIIYLLDESGEIKETLGEAQEYLGKATNNMAEYHAIVIGLKKAIELGVKDLDVRLDSQLAVRQINGIYRVKNPELAKKFAEIYVLRQSFDKITFTHVRREFNKVADAIVNRVLDAQV